MSAAPSAMQRRMRRSGMLILTGLAVEAASLVWRDPRSFFVFLILGGALIALGIGSFLLSLLTPEARRET